MSKLLLLIYPTFAEFEVAVATTILSRHFEILTVGLNRSPVTGAGGLQSLPHAAVSEVDPADCAGMIIPGGDDLRPLVESEPLLRLIRALESQDKPLAAICAGPAVLGRAGVLAGRRYTASLGTAERAVLGLPEEGFTEESLVSHGQVLTAVGSAFVEFGLAAARLFGCVQDEEHFQGLAAFYRGQG